MVVAEVRGGVQGGDVQTLAVALALKNGGEKKSNDGRMPSVRRLLLQLQPLVHWQRSLYSVVKQVLITC